MPLFERLGELWDLELWFCSGGDLGRKWLTSPPHIPGARHRVLPGFLLGQSIINYTVGFEALRNRFDVVVISEDVANLFASLCVASASRFRGVPVVLWTEHVLGSTAFPHTVTPLVRFRHPAYRAARKLLATRAAAIVCMSGEASVDEIKHLTSRLPPLFKGTQVMPAELLPPREFTAKPPGTHLLFLGYFRPEKNIPNLIRAFHDVANPDDQLTIAGDGPLREELQRLARGTRNVTVHDYVSGEDKARLVRSATATVLPSTFEPWGLVVNESLYFGTPVIACEGIGASELLVEDVNGLLFPWDADGAALRATLQRFLNDLPLRDRLVSGARETPTELLCSLSLGTRAIEQAIVSLSTHPWP